MFSTRIRNVLLGRSVAGALAAALLFAACQGDSTTPSRNVDLTVAKSHTGDFTQGATGSYSITVSNDGSDPSTGTISVTDQLPTGLTFVAAAGAGWACTEAPVGTVTCTRTTAIAAGGNAPVISLTVTVGAAAVPTVTNTVTVSGGGDGDNSNNDDADATTVASAAVTDLTIVKAHTGDFTRGTFGSYTITVTNNGTKASTGTITVTDALPAGLNFNAAGGTGWTCAEAPARTVTCTSDDVIAIGAVAPVIDMAVTAGPAAVPSVTNTATVAGGGDAEAGNNSSSDLTTVLAADITVTLTHTGDFVQGTPGDYTVTVSNDGTAASTGTIVVTDALPVGLTFNAANGTGWTCSETPAGTVKCSSATALAAGASASVIHLTVNVGVAAVPSVTNTVVVTGGLDNDPANNTSADPTTVNPPATDYFIGVIAGNNGVTRGRVAFDILEDSSAATGTYNLNGNHHTFTSVVVNNGQVVATDGNLTFTGAITETDITGEFTGGLVDGLFTAIPALTPTGATAYCGAHIGYSNLGRPAGGVFAFVRRGATIRGAMTTINGRMRGFVSGPVGNLVIDTVNANTNLTVIAGTFSGSYTAVQGDNALLAGSACPTSPPSPSLNEIAGVFGNNSTTTNNAFGSVAVSLSSNGVGSTGGFTDSTGIHPFDQVISGPGNRVFLFTAAHPFIGTMTGGSLTGDTFDASDKNGLFSGVVRSTGVPVVQYCGTHAGSVTGGGTVRGSFAFLQIGTSGLSGVFTSDNADLAPGFVAGDAGNDAATMGGQSGATVLTDALGFSGFYALPGAAAPSGSLSGTVCP